MSQQIRRLEDKVGHDLFRRGPRGVVLGNGQVGHLRIGFAASLALTVLPGLLRTFRRQFPGVHLDIHEMTTAPQLAALRDEDIDIGLLRVLETVLNEPFVAVLPVAHPLAAQRTLQLAQLSGSPFVLLPRRVGPGLYDQITGLRVSAGFPPRIAQHAVEWQTVCALVEAGLGVSVAPASIRRIRLKGVTFRGLAPGTTRTRVVVAWRKDDTTPLVASLLATVGQAPPGRP